MLIRNHLHKAGGFLKKRGENQMMSQTIVKWKAYLKHLQELKL